MNRILDQIPLYASKEISDMVRNDPSIVNLSIGEPYYDPPECLFKSFESNGLDSLRPSRSNRYSDPRGEYILREEISKRYERLYGAAVDPNTNLLVTHGAAGAILVSLLTVTSEGDEILIADPSYMLYECVSRLLGRKPIKIPTKSKNNFCLSLEDIESSISANTTAILINSPENPTGAVYGRRLIKGIRDLARKHNLYFLHDEVYDSFVFDGKHENVLQLEANIDERCMLINSFSKQFSMMGYRLGWLLGAKSNIDEAVKIHTLLTLTLSSPEQIAGASILNAEDTFPYLETNLSVIRENVSILATALDDSWAFDLMYTAPKGAFFVFPNVSALYESLPDSYKLMDKTVGECVAKFLLVEHKIAVVPGYVYGRQGENHVRIVAAVEREVIFEAANRIRAIAMPELRESAGQKQIVDNAGN